MSEHAQCVADWFGAAYDALHPQLRALHGRGGVLRGPVDVAFGRGIAGAFGRRLAAKLGIPRDGAVMRVDIHADDTGLHWHRQFNGGNGFRSLFVPVGRHPDGYWRERTGAVELRLRVAIVDGAWHWRHVGTRWHGIALPRRLLPSVAASKAYVDGAYRFDVAIRLPLLGTVLGYRGALALDHA